MTTALTVKKVSPWKPSRRSVRDARDYVPVSKLTPPRTPGRRVSIYDKEWPDWRWREADKIFNSISNPSDYKPGRDADPLIAANIVPFVWHMKTGSSGYAAAQNMRMRYPDLWWAHNVSKESPIKEYFMQAAIMAGVPTGDIADKLCVYDEQVWWYEKTFFDVRDFLQDDVWVISSVLYPSLQRMGPLHIQDFMWKALAWRSGLDWETFLHLINPVEPLAGEARMHVLGMLDRKIIEDTLLAVFSRVPNRFNENFIVDQYLKILEIDKDADTSSGDRQKDSNLLVLMKTIQNSFHMASIDHDFDGVEPRAHTELVSAFQERERMVAEAERTQPGDQNE
jgi:hypothetical protein